MTKKTLIIGAAALAVTTLISIKTVSAYQGDLTVKGPNYTPERHAEMQEAFASGDYNAWKTLMEETATGGRKRVLDLVTEENFDELAKAKQLIAEGKTENNQEKIDQGKTMLEELGFGMRPQDGSGRSQEDRGQGKGGHRGAGRGQGAGDCTCPYVE